MEGLTWLPYAQLIWLIGKDYERTRPEFTYLAEGGISTGLVSPGQVHMPLDKHQPWALRAEFRDGICGGLVMSRGIARRYAELLASGASNQLKKALKDQGLITPEDIAAWMEQNTQVFPMDEGGPYVYAYQVGSMLYQAGCRGNVPGIKTGNPGAALRGAGHVLPGRIYFGGDYSFRIEEHPVHVKDSHGGVRHALPMFQVATGVVLDFEARILRQPAHLGEDVYRRLWHLAQEEGLGSRRELGHGKFRLVRCEPIG